MVLSALFVLGFVALENSRYLTDSLRWQAHTHVKRSYLDWELESAINCTAVHLSYVQYASQASSSQNILPPDECITDGNIGISIEKQDEVNQFKIASQADNTATSAIVRLGNMKQDAAVISNLAITTSLLASSEFVEPSALLTFYGHTSVEQLQSRWGEELNITAAAQCGYEILARIQQSETILLVIGDCSINQSQWNQIALASQDKPLYLLFMGELLQLSGTGTLHGVLALWQTDEGKLIIDGDPHIQGGLILQLSAPIESLSGEISVIEDSELLLESRFRFSQRSWVRGSWRDF
ncbi:hypothetical protein A9264_10025 [Vibrio sp. UCD-FRSSP16_10]|nr:hypothetical protein A9260_10250 [Vibrio sp. UCD-FRSSP16_30]OBT21909.1 hypothetical protein A9264_10025 [Vibrio sp. UCD-FRSSP16_10]